MNLETLLNFGLIDNGVMVLAFYYTYLNLEIYVEKHLNIKLSAFVLGVISAGLANTISDALGFILQGEFIYGLVVGLGCLLAMLLIPVLEYFKKHKRLKTESEKEGNLYDYK